MSEESATQTPQAVPQEQQQAAPPATQAAPPAPDARAAPSAEPAKPAEPAAEEAKPQAAAQARQPKSDKFVQALEREKALREQERRAKTAMAELQKREAEFKARMQSVGDPASDPIAYLEKLGVPFEKVVSSITQREPPKVEDKVRELETKLEQYKREQAEAARQAALEQQKADLEEFRRSAVEYVNRDAEKNELIAAFDAQEYVPQLIAQYARQYDKVLDVDEAAKLVRDDLEAVVEKVAATKWFQAKYQKVGAVHAPPATPAKEAVSSEPKREATTLSAGVTATAAAVEQAQQRPMTAAEAREKALEILRSHMNRSA